MASQNGQFMAKEGRGGAASKVWESNNTTFDVVHNYRWTLSNKLNPNTPDSLDEVPYIKLREYRVDESTIKTQLTYYLTGGGQTLQNISGDVLDSLGDAVNFASGFSNIDLNVNTSGINKTDRDLLSPYENLFPRNPTGNNYTFPYFDDVNFEVNTPQWASLDTLEAGANFATAAAGVLRGEGAANIVGGLLRGTGAAVGAGLAMAYPKIGIMDRPKLWQSHDYRTIQIKFPLFNTVNANDWYRNRNLCWILVNQNLFTKRDFITGIPPVYYEVVVPGQHYSYAACVTNITIYNRGNMRKFKEPDGSDAIVPDAYEVNMTLTDMVMPSRNLFQAIQAEAKKVTADVITSSTNPTENSARNQGAQARQNLGENLPSIIAGAASALPGASIAVQTTRQLLNSSYNPFRSL